MLHLPNVDVFMYLNIIFTLIYSADTDKMQQFVALDLGLHCLSKYLLGVNGLASMNKYPL